MKCSQPAWLNQVDAQYTFVQYADPKVLVPRPESSETPFRNHRRNYCTSATCAYSVCAVDQGRIVYCLILKTQQMDRSHCFDHERNAAARSEAGCDLQIAFGRLTYSPIITEKSQKNFSASTCNNLVWGRGSKRQPQALSVFRCFRRSKGSRIAGKLCLLLR